MNAGDISKFVNSFPNLTKEQKDELYNLIVKWYVDNFDGGVL